MLRRITGLLLFAAMLAVPATASATHGGGKTSYGYLSVTSHCDDAIQISVNGGDAVVLEPLQTQTLAFEAATVQLTASLVSNPSVSATASCKILKGKTTQATVTTVSATTLSIALKSAKR